MTSSTGPAETGEAAAPADPGALPIDPLASGWSRWAAGRELPLLACVVLVLALAALAFRGLVAFASMRETVEHTISGVERLFFVPSDSSPEFIFPSFAWMLWNRRRRLRAALVAPGTAWIGVPALLAAGAVTVWSYYVAQPPLLLVGLAGVLLGAGWLLGGAAAVRTLLVPAIFLQLAWPLPGVLVNQIVYPLQLAAGSLASSFLSLLGIPWQRAGDLIFTEGRVFQVIETCSGLRAITTLVMAAFLYAELFHRSTRRLVWLVGLSIGIAYFLNAVRVLTIILNPYAQISEVHTAQGLIAIVAGVLVLALADALLDRIPFERERGDASRRVPRVPRAPVRRGRWAAVSAVLALVAGATALVGTWQPPVDAHVRLKSRVPTQLAGWAGEPTKIDEQFLGTVRHSDAVSRLYRRGSEQVSILVLEDNRSHQLLSVDSPKTAIGTSGWDCLERRPVTLADGRPAELLVLRSVRGDQQLVLHWEDGIRSFGSELLRSVLSLDRSALRRTEPARSVRLSTSLERGAGAREAAEQRLRELATDLAPALAALERS